MYDSATSVNSEITVINATGVFKGTSLDDLKPASINEFEIPPNSSLSIFNGIITLRNATGTYVGRSLDSLIEI